MPTREKRDTMPSPRLEPFGKSLFERVDALERKVNNLTVLAGENAEKIESLEYRIRQLEGNTP